MATIPPIKMVSWGMVYDIVLPTATFTNSSMYWRLGCTMKVDSVQPMFFPNTRRNTIPPQVDPRKSCPQRLAPTRSGRHVKNLMLDTSNEDDLLGEMR
jgi:hypothetical protein